MGRILLGTCSWTDRSLIECGLFYPPQVKTPEERLRFYAAHFPIVEVDSSYYALPARRNSELWVRRTPEEFVSHVKAYALFTGHAADPRALPKDLQGDLPAGLRTKTRVYMKDLPPSMQQETWRLFQDALAPLAEAGKLGLVLFQFPPWFHPGRDSRRYVLECQERLPGRRLAVEFRNVAWLAGDSQQRTLGFLRDNGLTYVCVDSPQGFSSSVPPLAAATTELGYARFHGRNRESWERKGSTASERFDYYYSAEELESWIPALYSLQEETRATHVLFNTNYRDQGIVNARQLALLLGDGWG
jgi:uncharacterized protein YecE (DUF72 family)